MVPLGLAATASNIILYYLKGGYHNLVAAGLVGLIIPWTIVLMGEDIEALRAAKTAKGDRYKSIKTFCIRHHVRPILATSAFVISLIYNVK